jgi:arsenate reductase-like glutaredoxin family protein
MGKRIDWYYHRKGWTSCKRADAFLEGRAVTVRETVDAKKQRFGEADLDELLEGANKVITARGKKELVFDLKKGEYDRAELVKNVLGPSGNLRAPSLRMGKTWLVGFGEETYEKQLG